MDLETRQERLEPGEAELLAEKREYERNLKNLDALPLLENNFG